MENQELLSTESNDNSISNIKKERSEEEILKLYFEKNNLSEFIPKFIEQKVFSIEILKELSDSDLEKLGFSILGERKKILKLFSNNEIEKFKNEILYKDLSTEERAKLDIPENKILKQNKFRYSGASIFAENGTLTLFENRIVWKGDVNSFIIPINKILDVSIKNSAGTSVLKISDDVKVHDFYMVDRVSLGLAGAAMGGGGLEYMGLAIMNDKPMTDIEYWRVLIEKLREKETSYDGDRGKQIQESSGSGCLTAVIVTIIIGIIIYFVVMMNSLNTATRAQHGGFAGRSALSQRLARPTTPLGTENDCPAVGFRRNSRQTACHLGNVC